MATLPFLVIIPLYILLKDSVDGRSVGKRITGLQAVDYKTGKPVGPKKSFLRNITTLFVFFIEGAVLELGNDKRKLGDHLANTAVVEA